MMGPGSKLHARMRESEGGLVVTVGGEVVEGADTSALSSPTLLVAPVTDALKKISVRGLVEGHLDRDDAWVVVGYYLDDRTSHILGSEGVRVDQIQRRVNKLVGKWAAHPADLVM